MVTFQYTDLSSLPHSRRRIVSHNVWLFGSDDGAPGRHSVRISVLLPKAALLTGPTFGSAAGDAHVSAARAPPHAVPEGEGRGAVALWQS